VFKGVEKTLCYSAGENLRVMVVIILLFSDEIAEAMAKGNCTENRIRI
jgi:hypothetical protein